MGRKTMDGDKILVTIPRPMKEKMVKYCDEVGLNRSELIRMAIIEFFRVREDGNKYAEKLVNKLIDEGRYEEIMMHLQEENNKK